MPHVPSTIPKSAWVRMFDFLGTVDVSSYLTVPDALRFRTDVLGGETRILNYITSLGARGAEIFAARLGTETMRVEREVAMVNVRWPIGVVGQEDAWGAVKGKRGVGVKAEDAEKVTEYVCRRMVDEDTFVAVVVYRGWWWGRVSGQVYLQEEDFVRGAEIVAKICGEVEEGKVEGVEVTRYDD